MDWTEEGSVVLVESQLLFAGASELGQSCHLQERGPHGGLQPVSHTQL